MLQVHVHNNGFCEPIYKYMVHGYKYLPERPAKLFPPCVARKMTSAVSAVTYNLVPLRSEQFMCTTCTSHDSM